MCTRGEGVKRGLRRVHKNCAEAVGGRGLFLLVMFNFWTWFGAWGEEVSLTNLAKFATLAKAARLVTLATQGHLAALATLAAIVRFDGGTVPTAAAVDGRKPFRATQTRNQVIHQPNIQS